jgi:ligand-binding sensor domain-containing protein
MVIFLPGLLRISVSLCHDPIIMHRLVFILFLLLTPCLLTAQSYSSVQYNTNDGLASSTVYCMIQDKDGFMWFGTAAGLCRFDGTHFKTFTTADGLPDNEILKIYQDSQGRIWMLPFKNAICYYLNGKIYNQQNDNVLQQIKIGERLFNLFEDHAGTIWTNELNGVYRIYTNNTVERLEELGGIPLKNAFYFGNDTGNSVWFLSGDKNVWNIYKHENGQSSIALKSYPMSGPNDFLCSGTVRIWRPLAGSYAAASMKYHSVKFLPWQICQSLNTFSIVNDSLISLNSAKGSTLFNIKNGLVGNKLIEGRSVSAVLQDREKNWWISTLGGGVFRVPSENFRHLDLPGLSAHGNHIISLAKVGDTLYILTSNARIVKVGLPDLDIIGELPLPNRVDKIFDLVRKGNKYIVFSGNGVFVYDTLFRFVTEHRPGIIVKAVERSNNMLVVATSANIIQFDVNKFRIADTIWKGRSTAVQVLKGTTYVGTLHGLYAIRNNEPPVDLGILDPAFKHRIATLNVSEDGSLWVGTTNDGLLRFKDGQILERFTTAHGLTSNTCGTVLVDRNTLWLGTSKGLNKICIDKNPATISQIIHADGLASDEVIKLVVYGDTLFVCTTEGITYFDKTKLGQSSECVLHILDMSGTTVNLLHDNVYRINNKTLKISYVAISFKSAGDIAYKYRLGEMDTSWKTTRQTSLELVALPYGRYDLELVAENKFGVQSNAVIIKLDFPRPFWKTPFFYILSAALFIMLIFWLYKKRLHAIKKREKEKTALNKKMADMELQALRAQMNPHFTFNVLSSIQYYIGYNNAAAAQSYLAKFSKLIRLTLDNSKNTFITLSEEQRILKLYLDLEKMRFENKFDYDIIIDGSINPATLIPNMLLQPFVENAIKHGFKKEIKKPKVDIRMIDHTDTIHCIITDNGVGRRKNERLAAVNDHQPAGVTMVMDKTEVLRHYYNFNVLVEISDLYDNANDPRGTRVFITFPKLTAIP